MTKKIIFLLLLTTFYSYGQISIKEEALNLFKAEQYNDAILLLEEAVKNNPNDAELFYYLGWFNHYNAYDTRPLKGYDFTFSKKIFEYLDKAIELNPNYGDAKYFFGAECSGNAFQAMQNYDLEKLKYFYKLAYSKGAYPKWLIEYGENILNSCEENAILFTAGNADFDVCMYLQLHENFRKDVTLIPIGNIDRPWYVKFLKDGLDEEIKKIKINLTDEQIMDIHPFKWKPTSINILTSNNDQKKYDLQNKNTFSWLVNPDLISDRMHSKIESETASKRSYLSPQRAILLQIVEDNYSERPIFFSNFASPVFYGGLEKQFENYGLISKLTPIETKNTKWEINFEKLNTVINAKNISNFHTISKSDIPRISGLIKFGYSYNLDLLIQYYQKESCEKCLKKLNEVYLNNLKSGFSDKNNKYFNSAFKI